MQRKDLILILIAFLLTACLSSQEKKKSEEAFLSMFPNIPMNSDVEFWETSEKFINGQTMALTLENRSSFEIRFSDENDVYALVFENEKWNRLENTAMYTQPSANRPLHPKGVDNPGVTAILLNPQLDNTEPASVDVRIVVIGTIYENEKSTGKNTGAYIDVKLNQ